MTLFLPCKDLTVIPLFPRPEPDISSFSFFSLSLSPLSVSLSSLPTAYNNRRFYRRYDENSLDGEGRKVQEEEEKKRKKFYILDQKKDWNEYLCKGKNEKIFEKKGREGKSRDEGGTMKRRWETRVWKKKKQGKKKLYRNFVAIKWDLLFQRIFE